MQYCHGKSSIQQEEDPFTSKLDLNLRNKLVKCYIYSIAMYDIKTWTIRKVDQKYLKSFKMWCWRMMEKIVWAYGVKNEVLSKVTK